jgi:hypothetical protein
MRPVYACPYHPEPPSAPAAAGWGFGGAPLGVAGLSVGGMCGVVAGLGWGKGYGLGTRYITQAPEFKESKQYRWVGGCCRPWHPVWHAAPGGCPMPCTPWLLL